MRERSRFALVTFPRMEADWGRTSHGCRGRGFSFSGPPAFGRTRQPLAECLECFDMSGLDVMACREVYNDRHQGGVSITHPWISRCDEGALRPSKTGRLSTSKPQRTFAARPVQPTERRIGSLRTSWKSWLARAYRRSASCSFLWAESGRPGSGDGATAAVMSGDIPGER